MIINILITTIKIISAMAVIGYGYRKDLINVIAWGIIFIGVILNYHT